MHFIQFTFPSDEEFERESLPVVPAVRNYQSAREFLREFVRLNQPGMSHRKFSKGIGWPVSLLGDLIQGRKRLSVIRAIEFSNYAKITDLEAEYFLFLALAEIDNPLVRQFASSRLRPNDFTNLLDESAALPAKIFRDVDAMMLHALMGYSGFNMTTQKMLEWASQVPHFRDSRTITEKLNLLYEVGVFSRTSSLYNVLNKGIVRHELNPTAINPQFGQVMSQMASLGRLPNWLQGTLVLEKARLAELHQRINQLREWILAHATTGENLGVPIMISLYVQNLIDLTVTKEQGRK